LLKLLFKLSLYYRYCVDITITIDLFGSCCVYQVVIARSIKQLVERTDTISDSGHPSIRIYIIALLIPCILLCMIRTLKYLAPFSLVADFFIGKSFRLFSTLTGGWSSGLRCRVRNQRSRVQIPVVSRDFCDEQLQLLTSHGCLCILSI
jgi:amino acid permease